VASRRAHSGARTRPSDGHRAVGVLVSPACMMCTISADDQLQPYMCLMHADALRLAA